MFQYAPNPTGWIDPFGLECIKNKKDGIAREKRAQEILERRYGKDNVLSERTLRDAEGKKVKDPLTGTGRRVDFVVKAKMENGERLKLRVRQQIKGCSYLKKPVLEKREEFM